MRTPINQAVVYPKVQVQIVTYNSEDCIKACLEGVFSQTLPISEVVLIDNASVDGTVEQIRTFGDVRLICLSSNCGYSGGHNVGFSHAFEHGMDAVLTLNPDVILQPQYLELVWEALVSDERHGGAIGMLQRPDGLIDSVGLEMQGLYHVRDRGSEQINKCQYNEDTMVWGVCGAAALYRVSMLRDVLLVGDKVLDEKFFLYKEDVDLCWRALRRSWTFTFAWTALAEHNRGWKKKARVSRVALSHSYANQIALHIRHAPWSWYTFIALLVEAVRIIYLGLTRPTAVWTAIRYVIRDWRYHWRLRMILRHRDTVTRRELRDLSRPSYL